MTIDNVGNFFDWISKPMSEDDIYAWYLANNINFELSVLFKDFCFSFLDILKSTYLGEDLNSSETKIGMTNQQKKEHFKWCWDRTIENFEKENINFNFQKNDFDYFESFIFEVFYEPYDVKLKENLNFFLDDLFNHKKPKTKSDIEMFTDIYKILERSLK
jgi:hypothetical protein